MIYRLTRLVLPSAALRAHSVSPEAMAESTEIWDLRFESERVRFTDVGSLA